MAVVFLDLAIVLWNVMTTVHIVRVDSHSTVEELWDVIRKRLGQCSDIVASCSCRSWLLVRSTDHLQIRVDTQSSVALNQLGLISEDRLTLAQLPSAQSSMCSSCACSGTTVAAGGKKKETSRRRTRPDAGPR